MKSLIGEQQNLANSPPMMMVAIGVSMMSIGVFFDMSFPIAELTELKNRKNKGQVSTELVTTTYRMMSRSEFAKPKSRMVEPPYPKDANFVEEKAQMTSSNSSAMIANAAFCRKGISFALIFYKRTVKQV